MGLSTYTFQLPTRIEFGAGVAKTAGKEAKKLGATKVMLVADKGEERGIKEARKHIAWYIKGLKGASVLKGIIFKISEFYILEQLLNDYVKQLQ